MDAVWRDSVHSAAFATNHDTHNTTQHTKPTRKGWLRSTLGRPEVRAKVTGVLNGIDAEEWDPAKDARLAANFSAAYPAGKKLCKRWLQRVRVCIRGRHALG